MSDVFPSFKGDLDHPEHSCPITYWPIGGLTKRELFAAMAMQGIIASGNSIAQAQSLNRVETQHQARARYALGAAEALIAALEGDGT